MTNIKSVTEAYIHDTNEKCPECGSLLKKGTVPLNGKEYKIKCQCQVDKEEELRKANIIKGELIIKSKMRENAGLSKKWIGCTFDNFTPKEGQREAYTKSMSFAIDCKTAKGLLLVGAAGCGKTHLAAAIANKIIDNCKFDDYIAENTGSFGRIMDQRAEHFTPVRFISSIDLLSQLKNTYNPAAESSHDVVTRYKTADVLILDDLGTEKVSDFVREIMFEIINYRYGEELPLIITTNKTPDELKGVYESRIFDRIREMCVFIPISTPSQRITA